MQLGTGQSPQHRVTGGQGAPLLSLLRPYSLELSHHMLIQQLSLKKVTFKPVSMHVVYSELYEYFLWSVMIHSFLPRLFLCADQRARHHHGR